MKKKVMVTGASGLIGSHLIEKLLNLGYIVYGLDVVELKTNNNLKEIKRNQNFKYFKGDVRSLHDINSFFQTDASVLYHLASVVGVNKYMEDPMSLIDIGILGTRNLIDKCYKHNVRMLFTSTSEVYGKNPKIPWSEDDDRVLGPTNIDRWCYSTSKALCEHMLFGMYHKYKWPMSIIRFFNAYGPKQNPIYVVSKSIHNVLNNVSPELYDGGDQTRCFTYVEDVIDGIILAATLDSAIGHVINLGNNVENTIKEVLNTVLKVTNSEIEIKNINTNKRYGDVYEDIPRRVPNINKAYKLLGWEPKIKMPEGIEKTVTWVKKNPWYLKQ